MRVCLVTPFQPSSNPRLVKEADALVEAGYDVHVVAAYFSDWATAADHAMAASRRWTLTLVDWRRAVSPMLFHGSRVRHFMARTLAERLPDRSAVAISALARVGPELLRATMRTTADLYVGHNLAALPIVGLTAAAKSARAAFDAEDFHVGQLSPVRERRQAAFVRTVERRWLKSCAYVTAAAPAIAQAYRDLYDLPLPTTILNVFPLKERPRCQPVHDPSGPVRLYWFSQTIGADRGLEEVVDALSLLRGHDIELHLRGLWQAGFESALRARAAAQGVDQRHLVHHAPAAPGEMARLAAGYDVGLATEPGVNENNSLALSNKLFTYLLAGCAVLATATKGQAMLAPALGSAAAWCEPRSAPSLAEALRGWLQDRAALQAARSAAWQLGGERFNWDVERQRYLDVVASVLLRTSPRAPEVPQPEPVLASWPVNSTRT